VRNGFVASEKAINDMGVSSEIRFLVVCVWRVSIHLSATESFGNLLAVCLESIHHLSTIVFDFCILSQSVFISVICLRLSILTPVPVTTVFAFRLPLHGCRCFTFYPRLLLCFLMLHVIVILWFPSLPAMMLHVAFRVVVFTCKSADPPVHQLLYLST
jgi:hypothetical protein